MIWVGDRYGYLPIASEDRPKSDALPTPPAISLARLTCVEEHSVFGPAIAVAVLFAALTREEEDVWGVAGR